MGDLIQNAHAAAAADSQGKKITNLTPYLNDLWVQAEVGDPNLFKTKGGADMKPGDYLPMFKGLVAQARAGGLIPPNASEAQARKHVVTTYQEMWNALTPNEKKPYIAAARKDQAPFFVFMRKKTLQQEVT